jgi:hypothetical protein
MRMRACVWLAALLAASNHARPARALPALHPWQRVQLRGGQGPEPSSWDNSDYGIDSRAVERLRDSRIAPK